MDVLWESDDFLLLRERPSGQPSSLLVLAPKSEHPPSATLRRLEHEYALAPYLDPAWAVRPFALDFRQGKEVLLLEDPGGDPLNQRLGKPIGLSDFLPLAIRITEALGQCHARGLVHKDLNPSNILVDNGGVVHLTGFGIASRLRRERVSPSPPETVAGTLAYMAPEQTGRMNRSVDSRSDLYSLGVVFFETLTGTLPFTATDPLEWFHCHIARRPPLVDDYVDLPNPIVDIVMKLLAKNSEERYQSAASLWADLRRCMTEWESGRKITHFTVGRHDISDRLLIPEKLYGRESAIATLLSAFDRLTENGTKSLILISGFAGIGKSSLVQELHKVLVPFHGIYVAGKCDQQRPNIPYGSLAQALRHIVDDLLSKSDAEIAPWRETLRSVLGRNGQLIVNMVPELELIIGKQPPVLDLPPLEVPDRFRVVFRQFLGVFARPEHPLVVFLDDLQWADAATLKLLHFLMTDVSLRNLLLIGAYRDNEVGDQHPLRRELVTMRESGVDVEEIVLAPLSPVDTGKMLADVLHCGKKQVSALARTVYAKTGGNPFFTIQFLTALEDEGLLTFDHDGGAWHWDLASIHAKNPTDNVVNLLSSRLRQLPGSTVDKLKNLACLGTSAKTSTLAIVNGISEDAIRSALWEAEYAGLIVYLQDGYKFLHDRVQEAAYALIPDCDRAETHLRIGRLLYSHMSTADIETNIFEIVTQLNYGVALITSPNERRTIAELNLTAGEKARQSTAYAMALDYLTLGDELLPEDCWSQCYDLAFAFKYYRSECEFLTGDFQAAEKRLLSLSGHAKMSLDAAAVTCLQASLYQALDRNDRAIEVALVYLQRVGISWTAAPTIEELRPEYEKLWQLLAANPIETLLDLPLMVDKHKIATLDVLTSMLAPALLTSDTLFRLVVCRMACFSLEHGNSDGSCLAYLYLNLIVRENFDDYRMGFMFGQLSIELAERLDRFKSRIYQGFGYACSPWTEHFRNGLPFIRRGREIAQEAGDLVFSCYAQYLVTPYALALGTNLEEVLREAEEGLAFARKLGFEQIIAGITANLWFIRAMRGDVRDMSHFDDQQLDTDRFERELSEDLRRKSPACWYWIRKLQAYYLAGNYAAAIDCVPRVEANFWMSLGVFEEAELHFYAALAQAAHCTELPRPEWNRYRDQISIRARWLDHAAGHNPENFTDRANLVAAEIARLDGREMEAQRLYEQAIAAAHANGFVQNEAVALEAAARFYDARGLETITRDLLCAARACYLSWGADAKVQHLDHFHKGLRGTPILPPGATIDAPVKQLDVQTAVEAAQALSGEIVLDRLIETLLTITLKHASADRGVLVLLRDGEPRVEAEASSVQNRIDVITRRCKMMPQDVPASILRYVFRTQTSVILDEAATSEFYVTDGYLQERQPRSVLCLPIVRQQTLLGALYLENTLSSWVFSADRISLLQVVASQAAISLENARLYTDLSEREGRIRNLVDSSLIGIFFWNTAGRIVEANDAFLEIIGYSREDLVSGKIQWAQITPPEYADEDARFLIEMKSGASTRAEPGERDFLRKDGTRRPALVGGTLLAGSRDNGVSFVLDLTERRQKEAEREARRIAEAANDAKSAFLANMSHELRTPMNAILGFAAIMSREPQLTAGQRENLEIINRNGEYLLRLINDVLEIAKIESGRTQLEIGPIDLGTLVGEVASLVRRRAEDKGLQLLFDQSSDFPRVIKGDAARLRQVLINLIGNAVKFTQQGGVVVRLGTKVDAADRLVIEVEDTGPGITPEDQKRLFQPFMRLEGTAAQEGTGLGLVISRQFVALMGGTIELESTLGKGSIFRVELPFEFAQMEETLSKTAAPEICGLAPGQPIHRVLIAEDQHDNRLLLIRLMNAIGLDPKVAENGEKCVRIFQEWQPDLIWMDRHMPVMNGIEATKIIRTLPGGDRVKIIGVTASVFQEQRQQIMDAGMDDLVRKPYRFDEIYECLARHLQVKYTYRQGVSPTDNMPELPPAMLAKLPAILREELKAAIEARNSERIGSAVALAGAHDLRLQQMINRLVLNQDYAAILTALGP